MSRDNETFIYYHVGIPRDSTLLEQLLSDAKTRGMLKEVPKLIATRLGDWYERGSLPATVVSTLPVERTIAPPEQPTVTFANAAANADAALDQWG